MRLRRSRVVVRALWSTFALVTVAVGVLVVAQPWSAQAQSDGEAAEEGTWEIPPRPARTRSPFELYDSGRSVAYEEMADGPITRTVTSEDGDEVDPDTYRSRVNTEKATVDDGAAWADLNNGPATHEAWSAYSKQRRERAALKQAEYEAGTAGMAEAGVE